MERTPPPIAEITHSNYRGEKRNTSEIIFCLISHGPYHPWRYFSSEERFQSKVTRVISKRLGSKLEEARNSQKME